MADQGLKEKIEELIRENKVLLFMKGTPDAPACGNSMRAVAALEPLREVTGEIADWRTFPQLYVNGELVGGCDIVEEMYESGELSDLLGAEQPEDGPLSAAPQPSEPQQSPPLQIDN